MAATPFVASENKLPLKGKLIVALLLITPKVDAHTISPHKVQRNKRKKTLKRSTAHTEP
jgi:hypothetical protein